MQNKMQPQENKQHKCKDVINVTVKSVHLTSKETVPGCLLNALAYLTAFTFALDVWAFVGFVNQS